MTEKEFPEEKLHPESQKTGSGSVDFSDLGDLFAPSEPEKNPDFTQAEETLSPAEEDSQVVFEPAEEESSENSFAQEETSPEISFVPEEAPAETEFNMDFQPESSSVDFSDLGPLFDPREDETVQPGEAALVLKRLSELPQEEATADSPEPQEELSPEPELPEGQEDAEPVPEELSEEPEESAAAEELFPEENSDTAEIPEDNWEESVISQETQEISEEEPSEASENTEEASQISEVSQEDKEVTGTGETRLRKRSAQKGRPKRKKGEGFFGIPNFLVTVVWIAITVLIGITLGRMAWVCASDVLAFGREDKPVTITIYEADTIEDITRKLHEGGLIRYPGLFKFYASLAVDEGEIHPGIWDLNTRYDYHALVNMMSPSSSREVVELMIPEGYSCRQIFALMEENKICTALDLGSYAAIGELDEYWFLENVQRGDMYCLEGFLFPDTYQFYKNDSPKNVLTKMLNNFESKFDEAMIGQIDSLNLHLADLMRQGGHGDEFIEENRFDIRDVINVASLIEKETSSADEGYVISSVIYNRLFNWGDTVPYLNIDATIVYALGGKTRLTPEDLKVNSPYNTYTHTGLTPGPIANPGLSSIRAALDPADSNYYFYVLDPALGSHRFSTTYEEHKANIASIGG